VTAVSSSDEANLGAGRSGGARQLGNGSAETEPTAHEDTLAKSRSRLTVRGDPYVVSVPEAATVLGISKDLAYDLARRGQLPGAFQLGRRWRVSLVKLRAAVHGTEHGPAQHAG
jgi:excisionase family DNA binding protein